MERNLLCFKCPTQFENEEQLCQHIQNVHKIRGRNYYQCTLCTGSFSESYLFKRHVRKCLNKMKNNGFGRRPEENYDDAANFDPNNGGVKLRRFEEFLRESAMNFAIELSSNMLIPRNLVYKIVNECKNNILPALINGVENLIAPLLVKNTEKEYVNGFTEICRSMFSKVETEHLFDRVLTQNDLIGTINKFRIGVYDENSEDESDIFLLAPSHGDCESEDFDDFESEGFDDTESENDVCEERLIDEIAPPEDMGPNDTRFDTPSKSVKEAVGTLMPIQFQIKKFFEEKDVFTTIMKNEEKIKNEKQLNHFINGSLWQSKLKSYGEDEIVIPYHLYSDETQINNALGTHCAKGLQSCVYYTFPTIPTQYASRLENIFVAILFAAGDEKKFGSNSCYKRLVEELNKLAHDGVEIIVNDTKKVIFFVLGLYLGDNKSLNATLRFSAHSAKCFCRICKLDKLECEKRTMEDHSTLRNEKNYSEDVESNNPTETGIEGYSIFNEIFLFHVTHSVGVDLMHDLSEGVLRYNMSEIILYFIRKKYFTLKLLNHRKKFFSYDYPDRGNSSKDINMGALNKKKLSMTSSEMTTFVNNFGFLVGDLVPSDDEVWIFYLKTIEVVDLAYLRSYTEADINKLKVSVSEMNEMYIRLFKQTLKPKHHFLTHYPSLITRFGPLRYISSLRFEGKHRFVKKYTKNTESRKNISFSLGRKLQYDFAKTLLKGDDRLSDKFEWVKFKCERTITLSEQDYYGAIENSVKWTDIVDKEIFETQTTIVNGIVFSVGLFLPVKKNDESATIELSQIINVFRPSIDNPCDRPLILYKKYATAIRFEHFAGYKLADLSVEQNLMLMSVAELLEANIFPVALHTVHGNRVFRLRNY